MSPLNLKQRRKSSAILERQGMVFGVEINVGAYHGIVFIVRILAFVLRGDSRLARQCLVLQLVHDELHLLRFVRFGHLDVLEGQRELRALVLFGNHGNASAQRVRQVLAY